MARPPGAQPALPAAPAATQLLAVVALIGHVAQLLAVVALAALIGAAPDPPRRPSAQILLSKFNGNVSGEYRIGSPLPAGRPPTAAPTQPRASLLARARGGPRPVG